MKELSLEKKKKMLQAVQDGKIIDDKSFALYQVLEDAIEQVDKMEQIKNDIIEKYKQTREELVKQIMSNSEDLQNFIKPLIPAIPKVVKGDDGYTPIKGKDYDDGKDGYTPKKGKDYFDGKDAQVDMPAIVSQSSALTEERLKPFIPKIEDIENDLPKLGKEIRDSLELLQGNDRLEISAIKGIEERLEVLEKPQGLSMNAVAGRDLVKDIDLSSQLNGVLTTFQLPAVWNIITVSLSSYPYGSLRKNIDYSFTPTSITFLTLDAITQLSAGQQCVLTVIQS